MKKIHREKAISRIQIGKPFEDAIEKILLPKTNKGNLSKKWNPTDWVRYALAKEIALRNKGEVPKNCKDLLKDFVPDLDL